MSSEKKKKSSKERDHALHDATHGQFGEEPRPEPKPDMDERMSYDNHRKDRIRAARKGQEASNSLLPPAKWQRIAHKQIHASLR